MKQVRKVLLLAAALNPDATSEGICSLKFLHTLRNVGYDVVCLTSDYLHNLSHHEGIQISPITVTNTKFSVWNFISRIEKQLECSLPYLVRKIRAAWRYASGYDANWWGAIDAWRRSICCEVERWKPDIIIVRGAGGNFQPHMAMLKYRTAVPWIANYHDPYPLSLYPVPYRHRVPIVSFWQERMHRRIIAAADALTFPSQRLLEWVLRGDLEQYRYKAFVIPHIANPLPRLQLDASCLPVRFSPRDFVLIHTGTLLGPRDPKALLHGFNIFLQQDEERRQKARIIFVGNVNRRHLESGLFDNTTDNVILLNRRVSYSEAIGLAQAATALILIEAGEESPFFPGKLADYLWLRKPILALSPKKSTTADLLGHSYPLLVAPNDVTGVVTALNKLWDCWIHNNLEVLLPPREALESVTEKAVSRRIQEVIEWVITQRSDKSLKR